MSVCPTPVALNHLCTLPMDLYYAGHKGQEKWHMSQKEAARLKIHAYQGERQWAGLAFNICLKEEASVFSAWP